MEREGGNVKKALAGNFKLAKNKLMKKNTFKPSLFNQIQHMSIFNTVLI
jgi:hypothetical protein